MSLESPAFEFGYNGNERILRPPAPLPVTVTWAPIPKYAGDLALLLRLKAVRGASLTINGETKSITDNDDISLPVVVLTTGGMSRFWFYWLGIAAVIASSVIGWAIKIYSARKK
jgi:hypothetical protein